MLVAGRHEKPFRDGGFLVTMYPGAPYNQPVSRSHMGIDHGGLCAAVAQKLLYGSNVVAFSEKMGCKAVSEGVNR